MTDQWIYGFHAIRARLKLDAKSVLEVLMDEARRDARARELHGLCEQLGVPCRAVAGQRIESLLGQARHQGVAARVLPRPKGAGLEELLDGMAGPALLIVLDGVTDPHNLGAVLRSADAFGAHAVIAPKDRAVGINATVEKVACGAAESVPYVMVTNLARTLETLAERGIWTVAAEAGAAKRLPQIDARVPLAWVLGAEGAGLRRLTREHCDEAARIPMDGTVDSLNVSVSAALCLYETRRQRQP